MNAVLARLHTDHLNIAKLMSLLARQTDAIERGEGADYRLLTNIFAYIKHYPDMHHHPLEDLVFNLLRHRDADCIDDVDELQRQHEQMTAAAIDLADALMAFSGSTVMPRDKLVGQLRDYIDFTRQHMNIEEGRVFPLARARLSDVDWEEIRQRAAIADDPLFGQTVNEQYRSLYEEILRESRSASATA